MHTEKELGETNEKLTTLENELVEHIEVIKCNVEAKVHENSEFQGNLEQRFADFTVEVDIENRGLRMDLDGMQKKLNELHNKTLESKSLEAEWGNLSKLSHSTSRCGHSCTGSTRANSINSEHTLYLFRDTSKTLVIDQIRENVCEDLLQIVLRCFHDMNIDLGPQDIVNVERIGVHEPSRRRPRPVKVTFVETGTRDQIFYFKSRLRLSDKFGELKISKEEPRETRVRRAKLRQAALIARNKGRQVFESFHFVKIEGITYRLDDVDTIPSEYTIAGSSPTQYSPKVKIPLSFYVKCRKKAERVTIVGPTLHKTCRGLSFSSENCFLSNFYPCTIQYRGEKFCCTEQGYQYFKAKKYRNDEAMREIMETTIPLEMKRAGEKVSVDEEWDRERIVVMEDLLWAKFRQNRKIFYLLMNTRPYHLIESTLDNFWGAGCKLGSVAQEEGVWEGENHLGRMLVYIRT